MSNETLSKKQKWFIEARFGMFIHFGLYTLMGNNENKVRNISKRRYASYMKKFNPEDFNAKDWINIALDGEAKYIVLTVKHAEGFCLWNSKFSKYTITNTSFKRDILSELSEVCDREKVKLGIYYNPENWLYDGQDIWSDEGMSYPDFVRAQLREILTQYGDIAVVWFDHNNPALPPKELKKVIDMIHKLQPACVVNDRGIYDKLNKGIGRLFYGDFVTPERIIPDSLDKKHPFIECCDAIGVNSWGYCEDEPFWSASELIKRLSKCSSIGANYLLNVEPMPNGKIRPECSERMHAIGKWLKIHKEAIFNTEKCGLVPIDSCAEGKPALGVSTLKGNKIYLHLHSWPAANEIEISNIRQTPFICSTFNNSKIKLQIKKKSNGFIISKLPAEPTDKSVSVLRMEFSEKPALVKRSNKKTIEVLPNETIKLTPEYAERKSPDGVCWHKINKFPNGKTSIGHLYRYNPIIIWYINLEKSAEYNIFVEMGAMKCQSDATFAIICGENKVYGKTWDTGHYSKSEIKQLNGTLFINKGKQKIMLKIMDRPNGHFADVFSIILQPKITK